MNSVKLIGITFPTALQVASKTLPVNDDIKEFPNSTSLKDTVIDMLSKHDRVLINFGNKEHVICRLIDDTLEFNLCEYHPLMKLVVIV